MKLLGVDLNKLKKKQADYIAAKIIIISAFELLGIDSYKIKIKSLNYLKKYIADNENDLSAETKEILSNVKTAIRKY